MARAKSSEPRKAKPSAAEELIHGIAKLRELSSQIDDLSRDGFPYREAGRARTELSLRETVRRLFGDKSPEYQAYKHHKLRVGSRAESEQSVTLIKQLIAALESQKADRLGLKSPASVALPITTTEPTLLTSPPLDSSSDSHMTANRPSTVPRSTVTLSPASMAPSVAMITNRPTPAEASTPIIPTERASLEPLPSPTAGASLASSRETSRRQRPDPSFPSQFDATDNPPSPAATSGTASHLANADQIPRTAAPPITTATGSEAKSLETGSNVVATSSSSTPITGPVSMVTYPPSSPTPSTIPIESPSVTMIEVEWSADAQRPVTATVASEVLPVQPPAPEAAKPAQSITPTRELSGIPPRLASVRKDNAGTEQTESGTLDILRRVCTRFHLVARQLRLRKEYRPTLEITDEYDLQDLFYALLRLQFDEVGAEEWTPAYANGARRTSYFLDWDRTVVVVKLTRSGLTTKDLAEQVKSDAAHYTGQSNRNTLLCFIYDPEGRVGNPRGLEADLTTVSDTHMVEVIVAPK